MEFNDKVKTEILEDIETIKKMLDKLSTEIKEIESGDALEFIAPIMTSRRMGQNVHVLTESLLEWQMMRTEYSEDP